MEIIKKNKFFLILSLVGLALVLIYLFIGLTSKNMYYFLPKRLNKIAAVMVVSFAIGYSTKIFQTITNNRLITPSIMGLDSIYIFIQTIIIFFTGTATMITGLKNLSISIILMVLFSTSLFMIFFKGNKKNIYLIVLAGTVISSLFSSFTSYMQIIMDPNEFASLEGKMFASFSNINEELLIFCIAVSAFILLISMKDFSKYDVLSLGSDYAINLGINYKYLVIKSIIIVAILVATSTVLVGPIAFLGIISVSLARIFSPSYKHGRNTLMCFLVNANLLMIALVFVEKIFKFSVNISVIINFVGGILFIVLLFKEKKDVKSS